MESSERSPVAELERRCAEEMARYRSSQPHNPRYCYELFRRALAERDEEAWEAVYNQYERLVRSWLGNAPGDSDVMVNRVFERFWRALSPDSFEFSSLAQILQYLKRCSQRAAIDAGRQAERNQIEEVELSHLSTRVTAGRVSSVERVLDEITAAQLFQRIGDCLNSAQERLVFRASFEWDMKPRAIAERWPNAFADVEEVYRIKERVLRRLRRDEDLKRLLQTHRWHGGNSD